MYAYGLVATSFILSYINDLLIFCVVDWFVYMHFFS